MKNLEKIAFVTLALVLCAFALPSGSAQQSGDCPENVSMCQCVDFHPPSPGKETLAMGFSGPTAPVAPAPPSSHDCPGGYANETLDLGRVRAIVWIAPEDASIGKGTVEGKPGTGLVLVVRIENGTTPKSGDVDVTVEVGNDSAVAWKGATNRTFTFSPSRGPHIERFSFEVAKGAPDGTRYVPFIVGADGVSSAGKVPFEVPAGLNLLAWGALGACVAAAIVAAVVLGRK
jgi:hypothetical protein